MKGSPKTRAFKSVAFHPTVEVRVINHRDDASEDLWYNHDDLRKVKEDCAVTIKMIVDQKPLDMNTHCARGLEHRTPSGAHRRSRNKVTALDAVMEAQGAPWEMHKAEPALIAAAYQQHTVACLEAAHQLGLRDERVVYSFHTQPIIGITIKRTVLKVTPSTSDRFYVLSAAA